MSSEYEMVFFVGPPYCGQDVYHHQKYNSYQRFRLKHFFMAEPNANLHIAILEIVKELRKHSKIIVEDVSLQSSSTRSSVLTGVKRKLPNVVIVCCHFVPKYGILQTQWSSQWRLCRELIKTIQESPNLLSNNQPVQLLYSDQTTEANLTTYSSSLALTLELEEFQNVHNFKHDLICCSKYEFTFPALIIETEMRAGISRACQIWLRAHPTGHIIVISHKDKDYSSVLSHCAINSFQCLVHCISSDLSLLSLFASVQYLFLVSFYHKGTYFVYNTKDFQCLAGQLGAKSIRASVLTEKPRSIVCVSPSNLKVPPMIPNTVYVNYDCDATINRTVSTLYTINRTVLPLYPLAMKKLTEDPECKVIDVCQKSPSIKLGMYFHSKHLLKTHEELCQSAIMVVTNKVVNFQETTPSLLLASPHSHPEYIDVNLSKEIATEMAARRMLAKLESNDPVVPVLNKPHPHTTPKRILPNWMLKERKGSLLSGKGKDASSVTRGMKRQTGQQLQTPSVINAHSPKRRRVNAVVVIDPIIVLDEEQSSEEETPIIRTSDINALFEF